MVLIFTGRNDKTAKKVCEWLLVSNEPFAIVQDGTRIEIEEISYEVSTKYTLIIGTDLKISSDQLKGIWIKKAFIGVKNNLFFKVNSEDVLTIDDGLKYYLSAYSTSRREIVNRILHDNNINAIGRNGHARINKAIVLEYAQDIGIKIPETLITSRKESLINFMNEHGDIITKSLDVNFKARVKRDNVISDFHEYTSEFNRKDFSVINEKFPITLFQKKIEKLYEIRTFFINDKCFSLARFSQQNSKTAVDFRRYDKEKMNRVVPYTLDSKIKRKIKSLMETLNLRSGSLDFILGKDSQLYFLEVNPDGQFGYLSYTCNYNVESEIAHFLSK